MDIDVFKQNAKKIAKTKSINNLPSNADGCIVVDYQNNLYYVVPNGFWHDDLYNCNNITVIDKNFEVYSLNTDCVKKII